MRKFNDEDILLEKEDIDEEDLMREIGVHQAKGYRTFTLDNDDEE